MDSTQEVIKALLAKFNITDNPQKFVLFEKIEGPGKIGNFFAGALNFKTFESMGRDYLCARPLLLCICYEMSTLAGVDRKIR